METVLLHKSAFLCVTPFFYLSSFGSANALLTGVTKTFVPFYSFFPEIYRKFIQLVVEHYTTEHSVSFYAAQLNLSLPHFCTTIKKAIGLTPLEIISSIITMDAKAQLRSTDLTVKEIAFSLGFNNLSFFNKYFRQHTGMTPQEYRRMKIPSST